MKIKGILFFVAVLLSHFGMSQDIKLEIQIMDLKSDEGKILMQLYQTDDVGKEKVHSEYFGRITDSQCTMEIKELLPGEYGVQFFHDKDSNGQLDTNFMGIPEEGFGYSNNPPINFGAPEYKNWKFQLIENSSMVLRTVHF